MFAAWLTGMYISGAQFAVQALVTDVSHYSDHGAPGWPVKMKALTDRIFRSPVQTRHRIIDHYGPWRVRYVGRGEEATSQ
jgi:hypothetical protein